MRSKKEKLFEKEIKKLPYQYNICDRSYPGTPDLFFPKLKVAIFFNGCFWHYHDCRDINVNREWNEKLSLQKKKDTLNRQKLKKMGIVSYSVWECKWQYQKEKELVFIEHLLSLRSP